ncbi:hypothetical protein BVRB_4g082810 isoform A [Beta vulgaris subsp. vulgaris]|nr:hypothetical protein BVRB_4g082810 isoform A [Beta vulgaris subsp. vulgaris]
MDPMKVVAKLRKTYYTEVVSIGPAEEPKKPKPEPKPEPKPDPIVTHYVHHSWPCYPRYPMIIEL